MFEQARLKIGTSYARFHFGRSRDPIVRFTSVISEARRPLIILPEKPSEASSIENVLKFLTQRYHTSKITTVARKDVVASLPDHRGFNITTFSPEELNPLFLPRADLLRRLKKSTFDVALDLNVGFALTSCYLCRASAAPLRIGFVKPYADSFYNLQVQTGQSGNLTIVYSQLLKCIEMF
jgi:hypothetical protein